MQQQTSKNRIYQTTRYTSLQEFQQNLIVCGISTQPSLGAECTFLTLDIDIIWFLNLEIGRNELRGSGESLLWLSYCLSLDVTGFREFLCQWVGFCDTDMADFKAEVSLSLFDLIGICFTVIGDIT